MFRSRLRPDDLYAIEFFYIWYPKKKEKIPSTPAPANTRTEVEKPVQTSPTPVEAVASPASDAPAASQTAHKNQSGNVSEGSSTAETARNTKVPQASSKVKNKPALTKTSDESESTKPTHSAAQSNTKAKRRQASEKDASTPKAESKSLQSLLGEATTEKRKRFDWAKDIENSRGIGSRKSDARIFVDADTASETGSSNDSLTDPTPPNAAYYKKKSSSAGKKPFATAESMKAVISALDFANLWSDTSPTGSAIDFRAGLVRQSLKKQPKTDVQNGPRKSRRHPANSKKHAKFAEDAPDSSQPRKTSSSSKTKSAEDQNERVHRGSAKEHSELSFGSADLRRLRDSRFDPEFVRAVGRGDMGIPLPKKRQTSLRRSNDSVLSPSEQNSTLVTSDVASQADSQGTQVEHSLDEQTELNTMRNRGAAPGVSSDMSARDIRRSSLELARRNLDPSTSPRTTERNTRHNSDRRRPVFAHRPTTYQRPSVSEADESV